MSGEAPQAEERRAAGEEIELAGIFERLERRERNARRNAIVYSIVPVVLAAALVSFTGYRVRKSAQEVQALSEAKDAIEADVSKLREQNRTLEDQKRELEMRLKEATELVKHERPLDMDDVKSVASRSPEAGRILELVLDMRQAGVGWHLGGAKPEVGFDSPGFALFVIRRLDLSGAAPPAAVSDPGNWLRSSLPEISRPRSGDLVLYNSGYAMFYFEKPGREPFVVGMTPFGITALKPDFSKQFGIRRATR